MNIAAIISQAQQCKPMFMRTIYIRAGSLSVIKFSNGIILQWGKSAGLTNGTKYVTLPIAYTNCYTVCASIQDWDDYNICSISAGINTLTDFAYMATYNHTLFSYDFWWFTIGY